MLLLLAVLSPRTRQGEMPLKLLALVMAGRGASRLELSELSVLLHGRGSPCRGSVSVSELLCRLAPERPALNLRKEGGLHLNHFILDIVSKKKKKRIKTRVEGHALF